MIRWNRNRYSNPVENLRAYINVRGGLDRNERQSDLEMIEAKLEEADKLRDLIKTKWMLLGDETGQDVKDALIAESIARLEEYDAL